MATRTRLRDWSPEHGHSPRGRGHECAANGSLDFRRLTHNVLSWRLSSDTFFVSAQSDPPILSHTLSRSASFVLSATPHRLRSGCLTRRCPGRLGRLGWRPSKSNATSRDGGGGHSLELWKLVTAWGVKHRERRRISRHWVAMSCELVAMRCQSTPGRTGRAEQRSARTRSLRDQRPNHPTSSVSANAL